MNTKLLQFVKEQYYTARTGSVREKVVGTVWRYLVFLYLARISSLEEGQKLCFLTRTGSPERTTVFEKMLRYVDSEEKAVFARNLVQENTPEAGLADAVLAKF